MVTTRSATKSLPAKRPRDPEPEPPAPVKKRKPTLKEKTKPAPKKTKASSEKTKTAPKKQVKPKPTSPAPPKRTTPASKPTPQSASQNNGTSFLHLPPEIRNEIYALSFSTKRRVMVSQSKPRVKEPALVAVSQQIRAEALAMWYSEQIFEIQGSSPAVRFLRSLSNEKLRLLRTIHIQGTVLPTIEYALTRINQLLREFGPKGLSTEAFQFQVLQNGGLVWANAHELKNMIEDEGERPSAA